jgi:ABC-2 type transport system ATP-binding protein
MRQRLGLAAALLREPRLLVLDEPTSGLDPAGARQLVSLVRRLADEGAAVVFSSHRIVEVEGLCDAVTVLRDGRVVYGGAVSELRARAPAGVHLLRTSDDAAALRLGPQVSVDVAPGDDGLRVGATGEALDAYVLELAGAGIAVRTLQPVMTPMESMYFELTGDAPQREPEPAAS